MKETKESIATTVEAKALDKNTIKCEELSTQIKSLREQLKKAKEECSKLMPILKDAKTDVEEETKKIATLRIEMRLDLAKLIKDIALIKIDVLDIKGKVYEERKSVADEVKNIHAEILVWRDERSLALEHRKKSFEGLKKLLITK